jgi:hypothetical protein
MQGLIKRFNPKKRKLNPQKFFLFNNLIVTASISKKKKHGLFLSWRAPISEVTIVDLSDSERWYRYRMT